jgi:hypothetical protein
MIGFSVTFLWAWHRRRHGRGGRRVSGYDRRVVSRCCSLRDAYKGYVLSQWAIRTSNTLRPGAT